LAELHASIPTLSERVHDPAFELGLAEPKEWHRSRRLLRDSLTDEQREGCGSFGTTHVGYGTDHNAGLAEVRGVGAERVDGGSLA
jgi:hypothetical protein